MIRHSEIVAVLMHAYGLLGVGRAHPFLEGWLGWSEWKAGDSSQGTRAGVLPGALDSVGGLNPVEMRKWLDLELQ